jgi:hypothetical protein
MKEIKLNELKKAYPKGKKKTAKKIVYPEDLEGCSQSELKEFAKEIQKKQKNKITYYPEYNDESSSIYSRAFEADGGMTAQ